jgi:hypothetical protein
MASMAKYWCTELEHKVKLFPKIEQPSIDSLLYRRQI